MSSGSYGDAFNVGGGGVFATWLGPDALRIYWWSRKDIPQDITNGTPDPTQWGTPASQFTSGSDCDVGHYFKGQTIVSSYQPTKFLAEGWGFIDFVSDHQHRFLRQ